MSIRFRRSIKVLPGVRINVGKKGLSTTVGPKGAKVTLGADGSRRTTVGLPGTGLSSTSVHRAAATQQDRPPSRYGWKFWLFCFVLFGVFLKLLSR